MVHLHVHSNYSLLDGGSTVQALVERARATGMRALALTDRDGLYGAVRFHQAATAAGVRPILGAEMTLEERAARGAECEVRSAKPEEQSASHRALRTSHASAASLAPHTSHFALLLLARSRRGFRNLCRLITEAQLAHGKGQARLSLETLNRCREGLIGLSGGERGDVA